jgi:poly(3-hydroxybutyrate) depolymerase
MSFGGVIESSAVYSLVELMRANMVPLRSTLKIIKDVNAHPANPVSYMYLSRAINASLELTERITRQYNKPVFGINHVMIGNKRVEVKQKTIMKKTFCDLLHFEKEWHQKQPKMLIVAPLSGHHATLCRGTVEGLLPHFDVYITDWKNARDVPLKEGGFDLDDFIDYCIEFFTFLKENLHVLAVCQPAVPVTAAVAIMSNENKKYLPKSMTLIGGPIDTRRSPTQVNSYAEHRALYWFENNVITRVPINYAGYMRSVYPGFIQLSGFMAMNMQRHLGAHMKLFQHLVAGDGDGSHAHKKFYDEYLAVMDLPAEFYLQTIQTVFKDHALPKGELVSRERWVNLSDITDTALLAIEGELDDITGQGQTKASIDLCNNIPKTKKHYHFQKGVGHYGLFNGSKFRSMLVPVIKNFAYKNN